MAILLLTEIFPPKTGGSARWFWEIYRRLPRPEVVVAADQYADCEVFDRRHEVRVVRMPLCFANWGLVSWRGLKQYCGALSRLKALIRAEGVETIHAGRCLPEGLLAWLLQRRLGLPYFCYVHGEELSYAAKSRELRFWASRVLRRAQRVIANSRNTRSLLLAHWQVAADKIVVLHPGVDAEHFVPAAPAPDVRTRLGWGQRPVVLTVGRLQKRKGQDMMIRALPMIRRSVPDILYALVGAGDERGSLEALAVQSDQQGHVRFHGELNDADMLACYQQCDLFVLPNREVDGDIEGFGMVLLEAQACGKPVLAGASGGTAETMHIPDTGRIVRCETFQPLANEVCELLNNKNCLKTMGAAARTWVVDNFAWPQLSRQARAVFFSHLCAGDEESRAHSPLIATDSNNVVSTRNPATL